jgi:pyridoxamine 5'-phosphate oxidase
MTAYEQRFAAQDVPRPDYWGGYRVRAQWFEFWQGRPNRVHDRISYRRLLATGDWMIERLSP